jgi:short-subunit dehydrogenase
MQLSGKHVVITGASSGIGEALARELAKAGAKLTLVSRREDLLQKLAKEIGGETFIAKHDLGAVEQCCDWIAASEEALGPIDVLVNNAGVQIIGRAWELPSEKIETMLRINLLTPLRLTRALLPKMIARGEGMIVDVASMAALAPTPWMTGYNATKAGLAAASESLRGELLGSGVHVVTVYPGPVDTPMGRAGYESYEASFTARATPMGTADVLARLVRKAIEKKRSRVIYPKVYAITRWFPNTTRYFLDRFTPAPRTLKSGTEA